MKQTNRSNRENRSPVRVPVEGDFLRLHRRSGQGYVQLPVQGTDRRRRVYVGPFHAPDGRNMNPAAVEVAGELLREAQAGVLLPRQSSSPASGRDVARAVRA